MSTFTQDQVAELRAIEKTRLARGEPGVRAMFQELINRLKSGGVAGMSDDIRIARAKRMFDFGVGRELEIETFEQFLTTVPQIPAEYLKGDTDFEHLVLEDPRIGLKRLCELGDIVFGGDDQTFEPWDDRHAAPMAPRWIRLSDGRRRRNRKPSDCRKALKAIELGTTALQGVCAYLQIPTVVTDLNQGADGHVMNLIGSVPRDNRDDCAFLSVFDGQAELNWDWFDSANPRYGSPSSRECKP